MGWFRDNHRAGTALGNPRCRGQHSARIHRCEKFRPTLLRLVGSKEEGSTTRADESEDGENRSRVVGRENADYIPGLEREAVEEPRREPTNQVRGVTEGQFGCVSALIDDGEPQLFRAVSCPIVETVEDAGAGHNRICQESAPVGVCTDRRRCVRHRTEPSWVDVSQPVTQTFRPDIRPVLVDVAQTGSAVGLTVDNPPAGWDVGESRPETVLILVVDQHEEAAVFVVKRIGVDEPSNGTDLQGQNLTAPRRWVDRRCRRRRTCADSSAAARMSMPRRSPWRPGMPLGLD